VNRRRILNWLRTDDPARLEGLWRRADDARRRNVGEEVHLRALVEFSNHCVRQCAYCGLRAPADVPRYRMTDREILACADRAAERGCGTIVLQSGEDPQVGAAWLADVIAPIKRRTPLAVTLSVGERHEDELALWRRAGADRYLLRFETSDADLYGRIHPSRPGQLGGRLELLRALRRLDYEVGSGVMVGLPGQRWESLAGDIALFAELELDMIGVGPYIPHSGTPMGAGQFPPASPDRQVPADAATACKVVALTRLLCPRTNIPATTSVATLDPAGGYEAALRCGANVIMPNFTPPRCRRLYSIYPNKAGVRDAEDTTDRIRGRIVAIGRRVGVGRGDSPRYTTRVEAILRAAGSKSDDAERPSQFPESACRSASLVFPTPPEH